MGEAQSTFKQTGIRKANSYFPGLGLTLYSLPRAFYSPLSYPVGLSILLKRWAYTETTLLPKAAGLASTSKALCCPATDRAPSELPVKVWPGGQAQRISSRTFLKGSNGLLPASVTSLRMRRSLVERGITWGGGAVRGHILAHPRALEPVSLARPHSLVPAPRSPESGLRSSRGPGP